MGGDAIGGVGDGVRPVRCAADGRGGELCVAALCCATLGAITLGAIGGGGLSTPLPSCAFHAITGLPCPFCGLTHSLVAVGAGDLARSIAWSPLGVPAACLAVVMGVRLIATRWRPLVWSRRWLLPGAAVLVVSWSTQLMEALT